MNGAPSTAAGFDGSARRVVVVGRNGDALVDALARDPGTRVEGWTTEPRGERFAAGAPTDLILSAVQRCESELVVVVVDDREVNVLAVEPSRAPVLTGSGG